MMILATSFITLCVVTVTITKGVASISFGSQAEEDAWEEEHRRLVKEMDAYFEKGKTNDAALKAAICLLFPMTAFAPTDNPFVYIAEDMTRLGISRERQIQGLENIIRGMLSAVERDEEIDDPFDALTFLDTLRTYSDYDILPILKESMQSKNGIIRDHATKCYNAVMEKVQELPKEGITKEPLPIITPPPQPEPNPPVIKGKTMQPIHDTPLEQSEKTSSNKPILWFAIIALLVVIGGVIAWKKKP